MMGYNTPNIDRIAHEGRSSRTTTQRTVARQDVQPFYRANPNTNRDVKGRCSRRKKACKRAMSPSHRPLKPLGYATGQFGKIHLGDRNEYLPPYMALMNSTATFITSMQKRSPNAKTGPSRIQILLKASNHAVCFVAWRVKLTIRPCQNLAGAG